MSKFRVIYVDDEADIREVAALALELDPELEVQTCPSGAAALDLVAEWKPNLVLLDCVMPDMDGPETMRRLKRIAGMETLPVVFVTARVQPREVAHLFSLGAAGVMPKPFDAYSLTSCVRRYLPS